jgi:hypothetical protein
LFSDSFSPIWINKMAARRIANFGENSAARHRQKRSQKTSESSVSSRKETRVFEPRSKASCILYKNTYVYN